MDGLLGGLAGKREAAKPTGKEAYWMEIVADQDNGLPIGFTTYRAADLTGFYPRWREFTTNIGDVDMPPVGIPMGPRHFSINAKPPVR
jgi:hypothetical protein